MSLDPCSDGELAALALAGRQAAFSELMKRHRDAVYRLVRGHCGDADAALDITQQAFVAAFGALARYDAERSFRLWIARIAINKARDWARRRAVRRFFTFARPLDDAYAVADDAVPADRAIAARAELDRTLRAIGRLPESLKTVLILRGVEGMSQTDAAAVLGIGEKAVETRLYRARRQLQDYLRD